jgi:hypothetical protein
MPRAALPFTGGDIAHVHAHVVTALDAKARQLPV